MIRFIYKLLTSLLFIIFLCPFVFARPEIELVEDVWDLGRISKGEVVEKLIRVKNTGSDVLIIKKVRSSCDCIDLEILNQKVEKDGFAQVKVVFDTTKDVKDKFKKYIYIQSNDSNRPVVRITVEGVLENGPMVQEDIRKNIDRSEIKEPGKIEVVLFYSPGCRGCRKVKDVFLHQLEDKYNIEVKAYDITIMDNYLKLISFEEKYGILENDPMIIFAGTRYFPGKRAILDELEPYIKHLVMKGKMEKKIVEKADKKMLFARFGSFSPLVILAAGLIDGINPCAFVTIVFLVSFLYFVEKKRREIFFVGLVFSFAVFLTYFLMGLGILGILHKLTVFSIVSEVIYIMAICMVFILAGYSLYDSFVYLKSGKAEDMKLQLPQLIKSKIHAIIRNNLGNKGLLFSVLAAGFLVSLLESVCTGQVYFPTIILMVKEPTMKGSGFLYLVLYNLAFIVPLLGVMLLAFLGVSSKRLASFSRRNVFISKLLLAMLFFVLGILLLVSI